MQENNSLKKTLNLISEESSIFVSEKESLKYSNTRLENKILELNNQIEHKNISILNQIKIIADLETKKENNIKLLEKDNLREIRNLNETIKSQKEEIEQLYSKLNKLNESNKNFKEENFELGFSKEKLKEESESMLSIFNLIINDLNSFVTELPSNDYYDELRKLNKEIEIKEITPESQLVCKIKILKNLIDYNRNEIEIMEKETFIIKSELNRNNCILDIRQKEVDLAFNQNENLKKSLSDYKENLYNLNCKLEKLEKDLEIKNTKLLESLKAQNGTNYEKVDKLNKMLEDSKTSEEKKMNEVKSKYELEFKNIKEEKEKIIIDKENEIKELKLKINDYKEEKNQIKTETKKMNVITETIKKAIFDILIDCRPFYIKYQLQGYSNINSVFSKGIENEKDIEAALSLLNKVIEK